MKQRCKEYNFYCLLCNYAIWKAVAGDWIRKSSCTASHLVVSCHRKPCAPFLVRCCGDMVKCVLAPLHQNPQGFHKPLALSLCALFYLISFSKSAHACLSHWGFTVWHQCAEVYRMYIFSSSRSLWCLLTESRWNNTAFMFGQEFLSSFWKPTLFSIFSCCWNNFHYTVGPFTQSNLFSQCSKTVKPLLPPTCTQVFASVSVRCAGRQQQRQDESQKKTTSHMTRWKCGWNSRLWWCLQVRLLNCGRIPHLLYLLLLVNK